MSPRLGLKLSELVIALDRVVATGGLCLPGDVLPLPPLRQLGGLEHVRVRVPLDLGQLPPDHAVHALRAVPPLNQPPAG